MASPNLQRGRFSQAGACYTVTTITQSRRPSPTHGWCGLVLELEAARHYSIEPLAWVLMPEHLHVVLRLNHGTLSRAIQAFKSRTARAINAARGSAGPVWQAGFYDRCIRDEDELLVQARYVIENPVRRGLPARCEDYPHWWCRWMEHPSAAL